MPHQTTPQGEELQAQNIMLESVEQKMDRMEGELSTLTLKIGKFSKQVRGSNVFLFVCCLLPRARHREPLAAHASGKQQACHLPLVLPRDGLGGF